MFDVLEIYQQSVMDTCRRIPLQVARKIARCDRPLHVKITLNNLEYIHDHWFIQQTCPGESGRSPPPYLICLKIIY